MGKVKDIDVVFEEADISPDEKRRRLNNAFEILLGEIEKEMPLVMAKIKGRKTNGRKT